MPVGNTLTVPLVELADAFVERKQVLLSLSNNNTPDDLSQSTINVRVNGTVGVQSIFDGRNQLSVSFDPLPPDPTTLEIDYLNGPLEQATLGIYVHDRLCEQLHPAPPCKK